jgi:hypothetical protein
MNALTTNYNRKIARPLNAIEPVWPGAAEYGAKAP